MNEQIQTIIDRALVLLAAATPGPVTVYPHPRPGECCDESRFQWGDLVTTGRSMWTMIPMADAEALAFAVNNIGTLCDALVDAERRAAETDAQAAAMREALVEIGREWTIDEDGCAFCGDGLGGDHDGCPGMIASKALANPAGRALLDRLERAEAERDDAKLDVEQVSDLCEATTERAMAAENAQFTAEAEQDALRVIIADCAAAIGNGSGCSKDASVEFMAMVPAEIRAEVAALRERAGIAEGRESAAKANAAEMAGRMDAQNAGLAQMARDRDALRVKLDAAEAKVARLEARTVRVCAGCMGTGIAKFGADEVVNCKACGGAGAVIVEGAAQATALTVAEIQRESYETARAKGWHDEDETPPAPIRVIAWMGLVCSEAAEAIEDARKGRMTTTIREDGKPEGLGSELADIVIRACDSAGALGIDMDAELRAKLAFNRTRSHKHGGKLA